MIAGFNDFENPVVLNCESHRHRRHVFLDVLVRDRNQMFVSLDCYDFSGQVVAFSFGRPGGLRLAANQEKATD